MEIVRLDTWSQVVITVLAAAQVLTLLALVGVIVYVVKQLKTIATDTVDQVLEKTLPKIQPTLENVSDTTARVSDLVDKISPKVVQIADQGETTVHSVGEKVKATSNIVTENVTRPIVNIASLLTGVQKGLEVWQTAKDTQSHAPDNGTATAVIVEERVIVTPEARDQGRP